MGARKRKHNAFPLEDGAQVAFRLDADEVQAISKRAAEVRDLVGIDPSMASIVRAAFRKGMGLQ